MKSKKNKNNGIEILIAEDSPTQAEKLQYLLEVHGYMVTTAPDGKHALAAARRRKPALIVSDVMMPEMDGFALCGEIKRDEQLQDVPVILLTTLSDVRDIMKGLECGADNFIRKPYEACTSRLLADEQRAAQEPEDADGRGNLSRWTKAFHHRRTSADRGPADLRLRGSGPYQ